VKEMATIYLYSSSYLKRLGKNSRYDTYLRDLRFSKRNVVDLGLQGYECVLLGMEFLIF
jgi:hypothetical protein